MDADRDPKSTPSKEEVEEKTDQNSCANSAEGKSKGGKKLGRIKRPMNAFMVWSSMERKRLAEKEPNLHNTELSKRLGEMWKSMGEEQKQPFREEARKLKEKLMTEHPDYKYRPRRRKDLKSMHHQHSFLTSTTSSSYQPYQCNQGPYQYSCYNSGRIVYHQPYNGIVPAAVVNYVGGDHVGDHPGPPTVPLTHRSLSYQSDPGEQVNSTPPALIGYHSSNNHRVNFDSNAQQQQLLISNNYTSSNPAGVYSSVIGTPPCSPYLTSNHVQSFTSSNPTTSQDCPAHDVYCPVTSPCIADKYTSCSSPSLPDNGSDTSPGPYYYSPPPLYLGIDPTYQHQPVGGNEPGEFTSPTQTVPTYQRSYLVSNEIKMEPMGYPHQPYSEYIHLPPPPLIDAHIPTPELTPKFSGQPSDEIGASFF